MFLMTAGSYSPYNLCVSWLSSSLPRPRAKRAAALAVLNLMGAGVAHFYTSYMFPDSQKPRYYAGGGIMSGACLLCASMATVIKWYLKRENKRMEEVEQEHGRPAGATTGNISSREFRAVRKAMISVGGFETLLRKTVGDGGKTMTVRGL
ncbi:transporter [Aspergillus sclerotialis]|uniref:Transporter n=1 Tax=Aspergillus sclerotialis TaxID=2070753 RepID=A0A3A2ZGQ7_9EURO|nr:transporter [Aspergillus sclerotialis]